MEQILERSKINFHNNPVRLMSWRKISSKNWNLKEKKINSRTEKNTFPEI